MVSAEDVIHLCQILASNGIPVWILGGWGIDALLGKQTRPHKDLDLLMLLDDVARMCHLMVSQGFELKEIWSENLFATDRRGLPTLTAFVLEDALEHELDFHAMCLDAGGNGIPAWEADKGFIFTRQDLMGKGTVAGRQVKCITAEKQLICHTGYLLPEKQIPDLEQLHEKFGVGYPEGLPLIDR